MGEHDAAAWPAILALGAATLSLRWGGWLAASALGLGPRARRLLRVAPGALFVAIASVAVARGGVPLAAGCAAAVAGMALGGGRDWLALLAGAAAVALATWAGL